MGFQTKPYDTCVANNIIDRYQCTISWHEDNLKVSHKHQKVVNDIISMLEKTYGVMTNQTVKVLEYLGMTLVFFGRKQGTYTNRHLRGKAIE